MLTCVQLECFMHFFNFKFSMALVSVSSKFANVVSGMRACMKLLLLRHYNSQVKQL